MIAIDWGTSSFRAWRLDDAGRELDRRSAPLGILAVPDRAFAATLATQLADWLAIDTGAVLMSGMIGSRQGWTEAAYAPTPAGADALSENLARVTLADGRDGWIVPGVITRDASGVHDVMRGEETQILGVLDALGPGTHRLCLPGTHSKWVTVRDDRIASFATHMTGETFALFAQHSILARTMPPAADELDTAAFDLGVARSGDGGGLLHHLFGIRAQVLAGALAEAQTRDTLSGLLVGHECRAASTDDAVVHLVGATALTIRYERALAQLGRSVHVHDPDAALAGLTRVASARGLLGASPA